MPANGWPRPRCPVFFLKFAHFQPPVGLPVRQWPLASTARRNLLEAALAGAAQATHQHCRAGLARPIECPTLARHPGEYNLKVAFGFRRFCLKSETSSFRHDSEVKIVSTRENLHQLYFRSRQICLQAAQASSGAHHLQPCTKLHLCFFGFLRHSATES